MPEPTNYRATHRVETPGRPPLYCLRETDALDAAGARAPATSTVSLLVRDDRRKTESWEFWRTVP